MTKQGTLTVPGKAKRFASVQTLSTLPANLYGEQANNFYLTILNWFPDFDEVLRRAGLSRAELRKLEADDEISAATDTRREAVIATNWHLEEGDGKPAISDDATWLHDVIEPWVEVWARASWAAVPYGYSVWETVYAPIENSRIGIGHSSEKPFEWFVPRQDGVLIYRAIDQPAGVAVDTQFKFFVTVREPTFRQPYGKALYSQLYWPWFYRKMGWQFWMKYLERWGVPFLVGHTGGDVNAMASNLAKMIQNATVAVGAEDKVDVLQGGTGSANFESFERAVTARVQKMILGQTLTTDSGGSSGKSGSYALGKIHNQVREDRRNADLRLISRTIQRQVNALWTLNNLKGPCPVFKFEDDTGLQLERAQRDATLIQAGAIVLTPDYFYRTYDYEDGEVVMGTGGGTAANAGTSGGDANEGNEPGEGVKAASGRPSLQAQIAALARRFEDRGARFTREQTAVEDLIAAAAKQLPQPVDPEAIKNAIRAAKDPDDLIDRLAVLFADADPAGFAKIVERAIFAGHVMGFAHAKPGE